MESTLLLDSNNVDNHTDDEISSYLNLETPKSFFLFAGAGSGKTRSLVTALDRLCREQGDKLRLKGKRIAVITYTNAACDEIKRRLDFNSLVEVSTIHSFIWLLIEGYNYDIKLWMKTALENDIADLNKKQLTGRAGKASLDRIKSIESKTKKIALLPTIKKFTYNPNGDNRGRASLNHSDVIKIGVDFLNTKPLMQSLLVTKFPILLIDESQDTNRHLMEAFLKVQTIKKDTFALGLLGDTMQRIYADGKINLGLDLPSDWETPVKIMNHRCPERIVNLINIIRSEVDGQKQENRTDKKGGFANLFILSNKVTDKIKAETSIAARMAEITKDNLWDDSSKVKTLILEHHMAAKRMGFLDMFEALHKSKSLVTGLLDGTLPGLRIFIKLVLPIVEANKKGQDFIIASIIRKNSPIFSPRNFKKTGTEQVKQIEKARDAVNKLLKLWLNKSDPNFLSILLCIAETGLFEIPESLRPIVARTHSEQLSVADELSSKEKEQTEEITDDDEENEDEEGQSSLDSWDNFLLTPFSQLESYVSYINGDAKFDTHQGVKGLQFPRVMVIIDDTDSKGFLFSYEKLFEVKEKTPTDIKNEKEKNDTSNNRTRRLLYVTCSRAEESLAVVAYSESPEKVKQFVLDNKWFSSSEIEVIKSA